MNDEPIVVDFASIPCDEVHRPLHPWERRLLERLVDLCPPRERDELRLRLERTTSLTESPTGSCWLKIDDREARYNSTDPYVEADVRDTNGSLLCVRLHVDTNGSPAHLDVWPMIPDEGPILVDLSSACVERSADTEAGLPPRLPLDFR